MSVAMIADFRAANGQFAKGRSGNPAGRPKGARNRATLVAEALFEGEAEAVMRGEIERALAGDARAARFLIDRMFPRGREETVALEVPEGRETDLRAVYDSVLRAMVDGEIAPGQALKLARFLALGAKLFRAQKKTAQPTDKPVTRRNPPPQAGEGDTVPVSDLYFSAECPLPLAGEGGDPTRSVGEGEGSRGNAGAAAPTLTPALSRKREREVRPVSDLYFSRDLYASTALGRVMLAA